MRISRAGQVAELCSDVDLLAVEPDHSAADQLAEALLGAGLADDVISLSQGRWPIRGCGHERVGKVMAKA